MIRKAKKGPFVAVVSLSLLALMALAGCVSTEKRYKKGQELESKGRLEEAAQRYIAVLAKEPGREDARQRLTEVGAQLVDDYLRRARADEADGLYENAVAAINRVDNLRGRTSQVGVTLQVPDDYERFRRDMMDAAVASLFRQGEELEKAGNWPGAFQIYERLLAYPLEPGERARVDEARARLLLRWAEQDMATGSFRAAFGHAQGAIDVFGRESGTGAEGLAVQKAALNAGTRTVAVLPFWVEPGARETAPREMESRLYDALLYEHMDAPPLFVGPIDRGAIHREMSRLRVRSGEIPDRTAAMLGLALKADFVVVGWLESYLQEDGVAEETARTAPLRRDRSKSVAYTEKRYTAKLTGEMVTQLLDPVSGRVIDERTVTASVSGQFRRAYYDGDYATLDLSRDERALFDKEGWLRAEEELQASLVDKLAERTAATIFERVLRFVK
jgi:tetratricopeptide (TPR) repeat protein